MPETRVVLVPGDHLRISRSMLQVLMRAVTNGEDHVVIEQVGREDTSSRAEADQRPGDVHLTFRREVGL